MIIVEELFKWALYAATAVLGWLVKTLWDAVAALRVDLKQLEVKIPETYVSKIDMKDYFDALKEQLNRIEALFYNHINDSFKNRTEK